MPKISIVAPVYGVERYINQFLDSLRCQTFRDFEAILVDDGSKDACPGILDAFAKEDERYKVIHQKNGGVSKARNRGLEEVTGEYVYIVDSDDWLEPAALEVLSKEAEESHADIIYGDWISEMESGSKRQHCFLKKFVTTDKKTLDALQFAVNSNNNHVKISRPEFNKICHLGGAPWRGMIRMEVIRENNLRFDPYVRGLGDDILFTLHLYEYAVKVSYIPEIIYHYRELAMSYSHGYKENYLETVDRIYEKQEEFLNKYHKGELAWLAYYTRVLIYLQEGMQRYFLNSENPMNEKKRYTEFKKVIRSEPYKTAIRKAPLRYMGRKRLTYTVPMLRIGLPKLYWILQLYKEKRG